MYVLLAGEPPFPGKDDYKVMESIARGDPLRFRSNIWKKVSSKAKTLITKMLNRDIEQRPTAAQVIEDAWFE
jgi:serine/threonine protein kinase